MNLTSTRDRRRFFLSLQPGDWINFQFGFARLDFYVLARSSTHVLVCSPCWCVSAAKWLPMERLYSEIPYCGIASWDEFAGLLFLGAPMYLGRGKRSWWRRLLLWTDVVHPFSKPEPPVSY
jgi:hypothetical protein